MENFGTARQATDENKIRRMRLACWVPKATHTHTHTICNIYCFSTRIINCHAKDPHYVVHILPVLFIESQAALFLRLR